MVMDHIAILSSLLFNSGKTPQRLESKADGRNLEEALVNLAQFDQADFTSLVKFASDHHVIVRSLEILRGLLDEETDDARMTQVVRTIEKERTRIAHALRILERICDKCEDAGLKIVVIKSLDHWPDLGSDLDLYTNADPADIAHIMTICFRARRIERSVGDRLAGKWNFLVPGLPELVEFHIGRLGQMGEQVQLARRLIDRAVFARFDRHCFRIPGPEDRLMISTLQRMYRHFYFRLCDIADTVALLEDRAFDHSTLRADAEKAGIWQGAATYLAIVSDYVTTYGGQSLALPPFVRSSAQFGGSEVKLRKGFLRVPIVPHSVNLFIAELASMTGSKNISGTLRLSLLPWLGGAAAVSQKLSGSDKGIW